MPKNPVRILQATILLLLICETAVAQQVRGAPSASKPVSQPVSTSPSPTGAAVHAGAQASVPMFSRDVCTKHPNLKQCS